uniref:Alcohol dehydrogenase-like C-terminal domain-containing protein n=1 Tax=Salix viminalis TaxID=40686 RepID=A0A6N2LM56_SALVM
MKHDVSLSTSTCAILLHNQINEPGCAWEDLLNTVLFQTDILPNSLPYSESAILGCAVFTAYGAMAHAAQVRPGDSVAEIGVGGVGSSASCVWIDVLINVIKCGEKTHVTMKKKIARAFGASDIIAVDVQDEKLEKAKTFGATATINSKIEDPIERIKLNEMQKFPTHDESATTKAFCLYLEEVWTLLWKPYTDISQCTQSVRDGGKAVMIGLAQAGAIGEIDINRLVRRKVVNPSFTISTALSDHNNTRAGTAMRLSVNNKGTVL